MRRLNGQNLVFLDESGCQSNISRTRSWSKVGVPVTCLESPYRKKNITVMGAIRSSGPVAMRSQDRPMKKRDFETFIRRDVAPRLKRGDVLVMDNLPSHRSQEARRQLHARGVKVLFTPPYSPEFNPIEMVWSVMKSRLRKAKFEKRVTSFRYTIASVWRALASISFERFIQACGYRLNS